MLERLDGLEDDPLLRSNSIIFGWNATGKKRAKGSFRRLLLSDQTRHSSNDGEARLTKKVPDIGAFLSFMDHCVMENRIRLEVASEVAQAIGRTERSLCLYIPLTQ